MRMLLLSAAVPATSAAGSDSRRSLPDSPAPERPPHPLRYHSLLHLLWPVSTPESRGGIIMFSCSTKYMVHLFKSLNKVTISGTCAYINYLRIKGHFSLVGQVTLIVRCNCIFNFLYHSQYTAQIPCMNLSRECKNSVSPSTGCLCVEAHVIM